MGGVDGAKVKKNFPAKLSTKIYIPADLGQKKYAQGGSVQVSLTITGQLYAENDKSKLETKRDVFNLNSDCWVNIVEDYLDWYSCRPDTDIEEFNIFHVLFTNLYWPNS